METGINFFRMGLPSTLRMANSLYQESVMGTPTSELFYPFVDGAYSIGSQVLSINAKENEGFLDPMVFKISFLAAALLYGKWNGKSAPYLLAHIAFQEGRKWCFQSLKSKYKKQEISFERYLLGSMISSIPFLVIQINLLSKRNLTLPLKTAFCSGIALGVISTGIDYAWGETMVKYLKEKVGTEMCADGEKTRASQVYETLKGNAVLSLAMVGSYLLTGETLKWDWKVGILSNVAAGAANMYL